MHKWYCNADTWKRNEERDFRNDSVPEWWRFPQWNQQAWYGYANFKKFDGYLAPYAWHGLRGLPQDPDDGHLDWE